VMNQEQTTLLISESMRLIAESRFDEAIILLAEHVQDMDQHSAVIAHAEMLRAAEGKGDHHLAAALAGKIAETDPDHPLIKKYF